MSDLNCIINLIEDKTNWVLTAAEVNNGPGCVLQIWKDHNKNNNDESNILRIWFEEGGKLCCNQ